MKNATHDYAHTDHYAGTNTCILRPSPSLKTPQNAILRTLNIYIYIYFGILFNLFSMVFLLHIKASTALIGNHILSIFFWSKSGRFIFLTIYHKT